MAQYPILTRTLALGIVVAFANLCKNSYITFNRIASVRSQEAASGPLRNADAAEEFTKNRQEVEPGPGMSTTLLANVKKFQV